MRLFRLIPALLLLLLVACTSTPAPAPADPTAEPTPAAEAPSPSAEPTTDLSGGELVIYSGRSEELVGPLIEQFEAASGIDVSVRYGDTAEMAAAILEEGTNSPADLYFGQDAGALGALAQQDVLAELPTTLLDRVDPRFRDTGGRWVGVSARARVVVYNTDLLSAEDIPTSIMGFTDPKWKGKLGWAPTNGSFQAFVTAMRVAAGEEATREWLAGIQANEPKVYQNNNAIVEAVVAGEIEAGFVNHYYLARSLKEEGTDLPARNHFYSNGDIGGLINVAGVAILKSAAHPQEAEAFVSFLLSEAAQSYFRDQTEEYPLAAGIQADSNLPPLDQLQAPEINLNQLSDLNGTLELLQELGIL